MASIVVNKDLLDIRDFIGWGDWEATYSAEMALYEDFVQEAREAEKQGSYVGGMFNFSVADGMASYRLLSLRPLIVEHLPVGDGYNNDYLVSRMNTADIKEAIDRKRKLRALFSGGN